MTYQRIFQYYPYLIPLFFWSFFVVLLQTNWYFENTKLVSTALTIDFLVTVPLLYFFVIRKKSIPKFTVFTVFVLGLIIASFVIPVKDQMTLNHFKFYVLPVVELGVFSLVIYKTVKTVQEFKKNSTTDDFYATLLKTTKDIFPKGVASILAAEVSMVYYGIFRWKQPKLAENQFTYYKKNALLSILGGFTLVIVGETIALHAWLVEWNVYVGWIISGVSAYTALQFFALAKSIVQRPISIVSQLGLLHLTYGFFSDCKIQFNDIQSVEMNSSDLPDDKSVVPFSPLGKIGEHNVLIHFKRELTITGPYGLKKKARSIALFIDEKQAFVQQLELYVLKSS